MVCVRDTAEYLEELTFDISVMLGAGEDKLEGVSPSHLSKKSS